MNGKIVTPVISQSCGLIVGLRDEIGQIDGSRFQCYATAQRPELLFGNMIAADGILDDLLPDNGDGTYGDGIPDTLARRYYFLMVKVLLLCLLLVQQ